MEEVLYRWKWVAYPAARSRDRHDQKHTAILTEGKEWHRDKDECVKEALSRTIDLPDRWGGPDLILVLWELNGNYEWECLASAGDRRL